MVTKSWTEAFGLKLGRRSVTRAGVCRMACNSGCDWLASPRISSWKKTERNSGRFLGESDAFEHDVTEPKLSNRKLGQGSANFLSRGPKNEISLGGPQLIVHVSTLFYYT